MQQQIRKMSDQGRKKKSFALAVYKVAQRIPKGKVLTYKQVAEKAGFPGAARAVGSLMKNNRDKSVPCHRVIRSDRRLGEYNGLAGKSKGAILAKEGVKITNGKVVLKH